ncbi:MAG: hypothetical protein ACE5IT_08320 [bacterium]
MSILRSKANWEIHDRIIHKLKRTLEAQGKYVVVNPGQQRNLSGSI